MKNIYKLFLTLAIVLGFSSCEDSTLAVDELLETVDTSGVILRTLQAPSDLVNNTSLPSIDIEIEVQEGNGQHTPDFVEVRVYQSLFEDQDLLFPLDNGSETLMMSIPSSDFYTSEINGLPAFMILLPTQLTQDTFTGVEYTTPTFIATRLEIEMTDGRVYTDDDVSEAVGTGQYFASPYLYKTIYIND